MLEADVEVDRREFTVRAQLRVAPGERLAMVGPFTPIGEVIGRVHLSATNTFLALVIAEVYESAPYYVLGAQAAFAAVDPRLEQQAGLLGDRPSRVFRRKPSLRWVARSLSPSFRAAQKST